MGDLLGAIFGPIIGGITSAFTGGSSGSTQKPPVQHASFAFQPMSGGKGLFADVKPVTPSPEDRERDDLLKHAFSGTDTSLKGMWS